MSVTQFKGEGKTLLLWLPSERGFGQGYISIALNLSVIDYDVWAVQLHDSYIIPTGRHSLKEVEIEDLIDLIDKAKRLGFKEIFLVSSSRGALLSLNVAHLYQKLNQGTDLLKGLLIFSPHLVKGRTEMGEDAEYEKITSFSNLPVYILQPQYSTKFARKSEIAKQLQQGGSPVYIHILLGIQGGFHMRPDEDLTTLDLAMRERMPHIFDSAISLLRLSAKAKLTSLYKSDKADIDSNKGGIKEPVLHPYKSSKTSPNLILQNLKNQKFDLNKLKGSVVLVNFWATWCGPCVEEIPSLSRLVEHMKDKPFKVVAVNIGESSEDITRFVKSIPVNFEILLDRDGSAVRDWKVYAYPSNYLVDRNGNIQFAYRGALKWDAPSIIKTIEQLL